MEKFNNGKMENIVTKIVEKVGTDKVMHCLACMVVAMTVSVWTGYAAVGAVAAVAVGIGKEVYDKLMGEDFDWKDVAADAVGAAAGAFLCLIF